MLLETELCSICQESEPQLVAPGMSDILWVQCDGYFLDYHHQVCVGVADLAVWHCEAC